MRCGKRFANGRQAARGLAVGLLWLSLPATGAAADVLPIAAVRALPAETLADRPEVRIRGVVTFRGNTELIVQDDTAGMYVHFRGAAQSGRIARSMALPQALPDC
jgi:hypothetical protein